MSFVPAILEAARRRDAQQLLIEVHGKRQTPMTGRGFARAVAEVRAFLRQRGVGAGDRVGLLGPNGSHWAAVDLAIMAEGAICVPLYSRQDPKQLAGMLRDAQAKLVIVADAELQAAIAPHLPAGCETVLYADAAADGGKVEDAVVNTDPDAPVTIIYTSGTSGEPKGVVLSARNIDFMLDVTVERIARMTRMVKGDRPKIACSTTCRSASPARASCCGASCGAAIRCGCRPISAICPRSWARPRRTTS